MKIAKIKLKNFRGYKNETTVEFGNLTTFIGKNDCGKSTILEALDIFFFDGKGTIKIDKSDVNVEERLNGNVDIIITVCFSDLPPQVILDAASTTTLENEFLLNFDGELEVTKIFHDAGSAKTFIVANHPTNENCNDLLLKKNNDLKKIVTREGIVCTDLTSDVVLRRSIWDHYSTDLRLNLSQIDVSKEDAKCIWEKLRKYLPTYSLFESDRSNSDSDDEVQDPLKEAVKQILSETDIQEKLDEVATSVREKLLEVSSNTLTKLQEFDNNIANSLNPEIPDTASLKWADVFKNVSISGDNNIAINKRGSGVRRLILLSFFRAEAERLSRITDSHDVIYAVEEPETSQHTEFQIKLIETFKTLAANDNVQIILTTHCPAIVKKMDYSNLRLIVDNAGVKTINNVDPALLNYPSLNEVNFLAFNEISEEYHNELYGHLEEDGLLNSFNSGKPLISYTKIKRDGTTQITNITITEYIRHQIHHPENTLNARFTKEQLKNSIEDMRTFIAAQTH